MSKISLRVSTYDDKIFPATGPRWETHGPGPQGEGLESLVQPFRHCSIAPPSIAKDAVLVSAFKYRSRRQRDIIDFVNSGEISEMVCGGG